ncbi:MAG: hypothetical protein A2787_03520 [Omnitrophica WOR_2 bacterium RIFCSPHIGHO2_01_FULL_48_9]|nr:MAG: hypothetical protein A3D10_06040 [Omnitrophica WOR_2 bacterium RIFCSPHIGHO2_02_FULL_48_11]OGX31632.1 MAG: hypothetical protein A2787_03520 [Omnitrophica WOR_2 bacterium RIFCSPHIGHO2_01_FULL_48_9]
MTTKNIKDVYFRIYPFDPIRAKGLNDPNSGYRGFSGVFQSYPYPAWIKSIVATDPPLKAWEQDTHDTSNYENKSNDLKLSNLNKGLYLLLASADKDFKFGSSLMKATVVNVTDLILMATTGVTDGTRTAYYDFIEDNTTTQTREEEISRLYVADANSGQAVPDVTVDVVKFNNYNSEDMVSLKTDDHGLALMRMPINLWPSNGNYLQFDPLAHKENSFAYFQQPLYFNYNTRSPYEIFIETDRPIYRPGDKVQVKAIVVKHTSSGIKTAPSAKTVNLLVRDTNYKDFFKTDVALNDYGSASTEFEIPSGRLLGNYSIYAAFAENRFGANTQVNFSIEEYKRPEFEMSLKDAEKPWKYNEPVEIVGSAKYYFGGAVPDAPVSYKIRRSWYIPYCFRYWFGRNYSFDNGGTEIASGQATTDKDGKFTITFTPTPTGQNTYSGQMPDISAYYVDVDSRDAGGRTIHATHSYRAGKNAIYFEVTPKKGFFFENDAPEIHSRQLSVNDTPLEGKAGYEVYALSSEAIKGALYNYGSWQDVPALQAQLKDIKNGNLVVSGEINYDKEGKGTIELKSLKSGTYRIILKARDSWQEEVKQDQIFIVAKDIKTAVPTGAYSITLPEQEEYEVGQTAKFLIGSSQSAGKYFLEIWTGEYLREKRFIDSSLPVQVVEVPVTEKLKGGFTLRWFGVKDFSVWYGQESVTVPWKEKNFRWLLSLSHRNFSRARK